MYKLNFLIIFTRTSCSRRLVNVRKILLLRKIQTYQASLHRRKAEISLASTSTLTTDSFHKIWIFLWPWSLCWQICVVSILFRNTATSINWRRDKKNHKNVFTHLPIQCGDMSLGTATCHQDNFTSWGYNDLIAEVLTAAKMTILFCWALTPCRFVGRYQRLIPEDADSMFLRNVGYLPKKLQTNNTRRQNPKEERHQNGSSVFDSCLAAHYRVRTNANLN
jgi:hypothetical protein